MSDRTQTEYEDLALRQFHATGVHWWLASIRGEHYCGPLSDRMVQDPSQVLLAAQHPELVKVDKRQLGAVIAARGAFP